MGNSGGKWESVTGNMSGAAARTGRLRKTKKK